MRLSEEAPLSGFEVFLGGRGGGLGLDDLLEIDPFLGQGDLTLCEFLLIHPFRGVEIAVVDRNLNHVKDLLCLCGGDSIDQVHKGHEVPVALTAEDDPLRERPCWYAGQNGRVLDKEALLETVLELAKLGLCRGRGSYFS